MPRIEAALMTARVKAMGTTKRITTMKVVALAVLLLLLLALKVDEEEGEDSSNDAMEHVDPASWKLTYVAPGKPRLVVGARLGPSSMPISKKMTFASLGIRLLVLLALAPPPHAPRPAILFPPFHRPWCPDGVESSRA